jgi:hypothetical protein
MLDTAARPSDLLNLYRIMEGAQRQILVNGKDMQIRYFYSNEVDPGSARQNSSNTAVACHPLRLQVKNP